MDQSYPFLRFSVGSRSFLARAVEHLAAFEEGESLEHFFYAALELRFGIEARLNEYLVPALESVGKNKRSIVDYVATKLLKRLLTLDPDADRPSMLTLTSEQDGRISTLHFTPVTKRLATIHGQLGELLHFKFFTNNERWLIRAPLGGRPHHSVADFLPLLREGIAELQYATSGTLTFTPRFTALVEEVAREIEDESPT